MARRLRAAMHGKMLGRRDRPIIASIVALQPADKGDCHAAAEEWIFAVCLLAAPPARIAKNIHVGRPEVETVKNREGSLAYGLNVNDSRFHADGGGHLVNSGCIEGRGESDRFRKLCLAVNCYAMQGLTPPVISWDIQARDSALLVHQLGGLLL